MAFCGTPFPWCFLGAESEKVHPSTGEEEKNPSRCSDTALFLAPMLCSKQFTWITLMLQFRWCFLLILKEQALKTIQRCLWQEAFESSTKWVWKKKKKLAWMLAWNVFNFWDNSCYFPTFPAPVLTGLSWAHDFHFVKYNDIFILPYDRHLPGVKQIRRKGTGNCSASARI